MIFNTYEIFLSSFENHLRNIFGDFHKSVSQLTEIKPTTLRFLPYLCMRMEQQSITTEEFLKTTVKAQMEEACGRRLDTPTDCQAVVDGIWEKLHEHVSLNTIKRLVGFLPYEKTHRQSTLDIIARYLDYANWAELTAVLQGSNSDFETNAETILTAQLHDGDFVRLTYHPERTLTLRYQGEGRFLVEESVNSKLQVGDIVAISAFTLHYPLLASNVIRNGQSLGEYTAGKVGGITSMSLTPSPSPSGRGDDTMQNYQHHERNS